jgi:predicted AlkP superfamily pyrophosphatase or phosphodiesterase
VPAKDRVVVLISIDGLPGWELNDPRLPVPNIWKLAREGVRAESMRITNPTVTWPVHTSMITGVRSARHGVLFNGLPIRSGEKAPVSIKQWHNKEDLVQVPTAYDLLHQAGFTTAEVDWVAIHNAKHITWRFPEIPNPEGVIEKEMVAAGIIGETDLREFFKSSPVWRDYYWTQAAVHILKQHAPNLLLFHLLNPDASNHRDGPRSWASRTAYAYADECVAKILEALRTANLTERATVVVVTDHGFKAAKRFIKPNAALRRMRLLKVADGKIAGDAYAMSSGGSAMLYLMDQARKPELTARLAAEFRQMEGIERVLTPEEFASWDLPDPRTQARMADLVLYAKDGYAFNASAEGGELAGPETGYPGHHGYPAADPEMDAAFLAWGYGIRADAKLGKISHLDVGPTIAALFGMAMPDVEGRALNEILVAEQVQAK